MATEEQNAIREDLFERLRLDLVGPERHDEVLVQDRENRKGDSPISKYLMGILYPANSPVPAEEDDFALIGSENEDEDSPEPPAVVAGVPKPSSIGISFAVDREVPAEIVFRYGLY